MAPEQGKAFRTNWNLNKACDTLRSKTVTDALETQLDIYEEWDAMEEAQMLRRDQYVSSISTSGTDRWRMLTHSRWCTNHREELNEAFQQLQEQIKAHRHLQPTLLSILQHFPLLRKDGDAGYVLDHHSLESCLMAD